MNSINELEQDRGRGPAVDRRFQELGATACRGFEGGGGELMGGVSWLGGQRMR